MSEIRIITNGHERPVINWWDLSPAERRELDYITDDRRDEFYGFRYRGTVYDLAEFSYSRGGVGQLADALTGWDGFKSDSYFSGVAVRYADDSYDYVVVGLVIA